MKDTPCKRIATFCVIFIAVCDLRLDFERFTTLGPADTVETDGGKCQDILTITVNTGQQIPEICGENSGQHGKESKQAW